MKDTVLITGASRGIGKAIAKKLAEHGFDLLITALKNEEQLREVQQTALSFGVTCHTFLGNLSSENTVSQLHDFTREKNIIVTILIHNAGISHIGLLQDMAYNQWMDVINTNLTSAFCLCKGLIPDMLKKGYGKIISISSVWGVSGASCEVAYSASKGGLNSFTKALAKELAPSNIQVNAIACGAIDTEMNQFLSELEKKKLEDEIPSGRLGTPDEVANTVLNMIHMNTYLTGQIINLDGGWL